MARKAFITGITGQDGSYLAELLLEKGYEVHGLVRRSSSFNTWRIDHVRDRHQAPLRGPRRPEQPGADAGGGRARTRSTTWPPRATSRSPSRCRSTRPTSPRMGVLRLLDAVRELELKARVYQAGSSEMFGLVQETPQSETHALPPPLALRRGQGLRPLDGGELPRELRDARLQRHPVQPRVAAAGRELRDPQDHHGPWPPSRRAGPSELRLGNLDAKRDWGFARDYVEAMWLMLQQEQPGRLRGGHGGDPLRARVPGGGLLATRASTGRSTWRWTPSTSGRRRWTSCWAIPARPGRPWAGSRGSASRTWCA